MNFDAISKNLKILKIEPVELLESKPQNYGIEKTPKKWLQEIKDNSQGAEKRVLSFWGSKIWIFCSNFVKIVISGKCRECGENSL